MSVEPQAQGGPEIENLLAEGRTFPPDPAFVAQANATAALYEAAEADYVGFWAAQARERLSWSKPFGETLEWDLPFAKWFVGGELNVAYNCVDRHVERGLGAKVAYHWIGEPGETRTITYDDLLRESSKAANALLELGVRPGDRVAIYMPMIPELPIAMLACARIGAPHTVVFGGFSAEALGGRINDCGAKVLITADGGWRRGKPVPLKPQADDAVAALADDRARARRRPPGRGGVDGGRPRRLVARHRRPPVARLPAGARGQRAHALPAVHVRDDGEAEGHPPHLGRLPARRGVHPLGRVRHQARRRLLVRGRHRLGHRPQLHRLRAARQRDHRRAVRGRARHADVGPLVADRRGLQGHDPVLRADRDPRVHEAGRAVPGRPRSRLAAGPRVGGRADQPRGLALVPRGHRRRPHAGRRHLVADRDGPDHDQPAARA